VIISQTPYRVSFAGGGTDLPAFYSAAGFGAVLSVAVQRHMYVTVHERCEPNIRVAYSRTEIAGAVSELQHTIVREAMRITGAGPFLEITTIGDVPAGTGMGSSSALAVGILNALHASQGRVIGRHQLAEEACRIEIDILGKPIGRQDQYAAAFGGFNYIRFNDGHTVDVEPVPCDAERLAELERWVLLMYTNQKRDADSILGKQSAGTGDKMAVLRKMRDLAEAMRVAISGRGDLDTFGKLLHEGWELKRSLGFGISDPKIDGWYEAARKAGAVGGKLLGAGGGGFLLLMAPPERHAAIRAVLDHPRELSFQVDRLGSRIIFISG
jgi:D-glycero-alpha-D-manno-heptose-7-phosphate kinase